MVQRNLFPHGQPEPVGEHQQLRLCGHVIRAQQVHVHALRMSHQLQLVGRRGRHASVRFTVHRRRHLLVLHSRAGEGDRLSVEHQPRRHRVDLDAAKPKGVIEGVDHDAVHAHVDADHVQRGTLQAPDVRPREQEACLARDDRVAVDSHALDRRGCNGRRAGRHEAHGIRVHEVRAGDGGREDLHVQRDVVDGLLARVLQRDADVGGVEVGDDVRAHHVQRIARLQPDGARDALVLPPVRVEPRHHVEARALGWVVHANREHIAGAWQQRLVDFERERRDPAFVVAEIRAVQPDVGQVVHARELQPHGLGGPVGRRPERDPIPAVDRTAIRRNARAARHRGGSPVGVLVLERLPAGGLQLEILQRLLSRLERQHLAQRRRLKLPARAQVEPRPALMGVAGHRLAGLESHAPAIHELESQRRFQTRGGDIGTARRQSA